MQIWKFPICLCSYKNNTLKISFSLSIEFLSYLPLKSRQHFVFFIFINKHFNTSLIFNFRVPKNVKKDKMGKLETNISTDFYICIGFAFKIKINHGIFLSKRVCRQCSVSIFKDVQDKKDWHLCLSCSQLLLPWFPEVVSMNAFLNDQINIFCCKHLKCCFFA